MRKSILAAGLLVAACATRGDAPSGPPAFAPEMPSAPEAPKAPAATEPEALRSLFGPEYDEALSAIGLTRETARVTASDFSLMAQGRFGTKLFEGLEADPTLADRWSRTLRDGAFASAGTAENASLFAAARLGVAVRLGLLGDPMEKRVKEAGEEGALERQMWRVLSRPDAPERIPGDQQPILQVNGLDAVPAPVQAAAALLLGAMLDAEPWLRPEGAFAFHRPSGSGPTLRDGSAADATLLLSGEDESDGRRRLFEDEAARTDLRYLARGSALVLLAADRAAAMLREAGETGPFTWRMDTPRGRILLNGSGDDADGEDPPAAWLLRIDTGGDDVYRGGAAAVAGVPASVLVDVSGNDTYEAPADTAAFGAGFFGVGVLLDLAGDDRYAIAGGRSLGLGAGVFGVGALLDGGGDDAYSGQGFCQGAGAVGWGTLTDRGGSDFYDAYFFSQGFGYVLGAGVLTDLAGDDRYTMNDTDLKSPSAQSKDHNSSLGQGFGFGVRADYLDGHSLAGGVGILADREGNDRYTCGVFGQGGGYWMGVGMLLDGAGDDAYSGVWYVQGACAHFAVGILDEGGGNDTYTATMNMAQGAGHDYSLGVLLDRGGNDVYRAPNLSLGGGNADGVGILIDAGGDDVYQSRGITLGHASVATPVEAATVRHASLTLGVFLDLGGGRDAWFEPPETVQPFAGNGRTWTREERTGAAPVSNERGVGADR